MAPNTAIPLKPVPRTSADKAQLKQQAVLTLSPEDVLRQAITQLPEDLARARWYPERSASGSAGKLLVHLISPGASPLESQSGGIGVTNYLQRTLEHLTQNPAVYSLYVGGLNDDSAVCCRDRLRSIQEFSRTASKLEQYFGTRDAGASDALLASSRAIFGEKFNENQLQLLRALSTLRDHQQSAAETAKNPVLNIALAKGLEIIGADSTQQPLVERIGTTGARANVTVLGNQVSLRSDVERWNTAHPSGKLILVEIESAR